MTDTFSTIVHQPKPYNSVSALALTRAHLKNHRTQEQSNINSPLLRFIPGDNCIQMIAVCDVCRACIVVETLSCIYVLVRRQGLLLSARGPCVSLSVVTCCVKTWILLFWSTSYKLKTALSEFFIEKVTVRVLFLVTVLVGNSSQNVNDLFKIM